MKIKEGMVHMSRLSIFLFVFLILLTGCTRKQEVPENPFRMKQVTIVQPEDDRSLEIAYYYDEQGNVVQEQQFADGESDIIWSYEYDEWGNLLKETTTHADGTVHITEYKLTLDEKHRITYREIIWDGELKSIHETVYDDQGNPLSVSSRHFSGFGDEDRRMISKSYDKDGNLVTETMQWLLPSKTMDENGNIVTDTTQWLEDPNSGGTTTYFYESGCLVRSEHILPNGRMDRYTEYTYDDSGLTQTAVEYENGFPLSRVVETYDEYGNLLKHEYFRLSTDIPGGGDDVADRVNAYTYELRNQE